MKRTLLCLAFPGLLAGAGAGVAGCTQYYRVTDPSTGKVYYTTNVDRNHGSATLKDARTGNKVTVQNSEVETIRKEEFEAGKYAAANGSSK
jgi:hypothetical protein